MVVNMIDVYFDRPVYDPARTPDQNLAMLERWAAETVNTLNFMVTQINKSLEENNDDN